MRAKTKRTIRSDDVNLNKAYDRWADIVMALNVEPKFYLFYDFLGLSRQVTIHGGGFKLDEEGERRMHMLLGPHCETVMRAWFILQNIEWK